MSQIIQFLAEDYALAAESKAAHSQMEMVGVRRVILRPQAVPVVAAARRQQRL